MSLRHLIGDGQLAVSRFTPVLRGFKDVDTTLGVTCVELNIVADLLVEALQPDIASI